jgi:hypothetical protein
MSSHGKDHNIFSESLSLWTLSIVRHSTGLENTTFQKLDLFPSSGKGRETLTLLGHLKRATINRWSNYVIKSCDTRLIRRKMAGKHACTKWNCNTIGDDNLCCKSIEKNKSLTPTLKNNWRVNETSYVPTTSAICGVKIEHAKLFYITKLILQSLPVYSANCVKSYSVTCKRVLSSAPRGLLWLLAPMREFIRCQSQSQYVLVSSSLWNL